MNFTLNTLKQWANDWLTAEPEWQACRSWEGGEWSLPRLAYLRCLAWLVGTGQCTISDVEPVIWTLEGERIPRNEVMQALSIGCTLTPASMQAAIRAHLNCEKPSEGMAEGLHCPQHQARFETFRGYLQHYREMHRTMGAIDPERRPV